MLQHALENCHMDIYENRIITKHREVLKGLGKNIHKNRSKAVLKNLTSIRKTNVTLPPFKMMVNFFYYHKLILCKISTLLLEYVLNWTGVKR